MSFNWNLFGIMMGYALFNGIGSLFFKIGLKNVKSENVTFTKINRANIRGFFQILRNPIFLLGAACLLIDFLIYQQALRIYEVSAVKPLVNLNLLFVLLFGTLIMKEKVSIKEWIGIFLIIAGAICISLYAENTVATTNYMFFWIFLGIIIIVVSIIFFILHKDENGNFEFFASISGGILYGIGSICNKGLYASNIFPGANIILIALFILSYAMALFYSLGAYSRGRMNIVSTLVNIFSIITPFIGGILIFGDTILNESDNPLIRMLKIIGIIAIIAGILLNYKSREKNGSGFPNANPKAPVKNTT